MSNKYFRLLNAFLWPVPDKNMLQANAGNFLLDLVMPHDAKFSTTGILFLTEMLILDMSKAVVKNAFL